MSKQVTEQQLREMYRNRQDFILECTPETSKRAQEIAFEEDVIWDYLDVELAKQIRFTSSRHLYFLQDDNYFLKRGECEITDEYNALIVTLQIKKTKTKLIETTLPCTNDVEAFTALLNGYVLKHVEDGDILRCKDNYFIWDGAGKLGITRYPFVICREEEVELPWYENIPPQGVLCKVNLSGQPTVYSTIIRYANNSFISATGSLFSKAIPVSSSELHNLLYENQIS